MRNANFEIIKDTPKILLIQDIGPWNAYPTITNAAEDVVESLSDRLTNGKRLFYYDSEGQCDELKVENGRFAGFGPGNNKDIELLING
jgi:hypothetical protein